MKNGFGDGEFFYHRIIKITLIRKNGLMFVINIYDLKKVSER